MSDISDDLIEPIEEWAEAVDEADILGGPEDFLVGYGAIYRSLERLFEGGDRDDARSLLTALAACEFVMAEHPSWTDEVGLEPIQPLSPQWLVILDDGSREFRLAAALNSLRPIGFDAAEGGRVYPFRSHLEPIEVRWDQEEREAGAASVAWDFSAFDEVIWDREEDVDGLNLIFSRRLKMWDAQPSDFVRGAIGARASDVQAFLEDETDEAKLSRLAFSLSLIDTWRLADDPLDEPEGGAEELDPVYCLARLCYAGRPLPGDEQQVPLNRDIHLLADRGDLESTVEFARAHLRRNGFEPGVAEPTTSLDVRRIAAALLFPLTPSVGAQLAEAVSLERA